jgi:23S rRNA pseudouridine2604 synthase
LKLFEIYRVKNWKRPPLRLHTPHIHDDTTKQKMRRTAACWAAHPAKEQQQLMIRLNKLMADKGICSRREADFYLKKGWVILNGKQLEPGQGVGLKIACPAANIETTTTIALSKHAIQQQSAQDTVLIHKPLGIVSCQPEHDAEIPAVKLLTLDRQWQQPRQLQNSGRNGNGSDRNHGQRQQRMQEPKSRPGWAAAGRLDINSTGLLVLTQSGRIAREIIGPTSTMEKEYLVRIPLTRTTPATTTHKNNNNKEDIVLQEKLERLRQGIQDGDDFLQVQHVEQLNADQLRIVLTAGKHHHIRRMCHAVGLWPVQALKRVRIGNVMLGHLPLGQWRFLQPNERFT